MIRLNISSSIERVSFSNNILRIEQSADVLNILIFLQCKVTNEELLSVKSLTGMIRNLLETTRRNSSRVVCCHFVIHLHHYVVQEVLDIHMRVFG